MVWSWQGLIWAFAAPLAVVTYSDLSCCVVDHLCRWAPPPLWNAISNYCAFYYPIHWRLIPHPMLLLLHAKQKLYLIRNLFQSASLFFFFFLKPQRPSIVCMWKSVTGLLMFLRTSQSCFPARERFLEPGHDFCIVASSQLIAETSSGQCQEIEVSAFQQLAGCWAQCAHGLFLLRIQGKGRLEDLGQSK